MGPHEEFRKLCAVSTSGELSEEEKTRLQKHLAVCPECRQALKEYQEAAEISAPLFAAETSGKLPAKTDAWSVDAAEAAFRERLAREGNRLRTGSAVGEAASATKLAGQNGNALMSEHWNTVWLPFAAAILLVATLGIYANRLGVRRGTDNAPAPQAAVEKPVVVFQPQMSNPGHEREVLLGQLAERDKTIGGLHSQLEEQTAELSKLKDEQTTLQTAFKTSEEEKKELAANTTALTQKVDAAQAALQRTQKEMETQQAQGSRDDAGSKSLQAKLGELTQLVKERDSTIEEQQELLAHDRDIRELMGARDLYVAEVMDVAKNGATQKSYGRVFFTKGKSLIFYAYDLDRQPGLKNASTFQAWGQRGTDKERALSLGVFYEDNVSKKRWVLKFDDPQKLDQIDAVFVTVEPNGGSRKPSGKPFLFAYLKVAPNHP